jgi:uncharacterized protein (DUF2141 family)
MRTIFMAAALGAAASPAYAEQVTVNLEGAESSEGSIVVCLWDRDAKFPNCEKGEPLERVVLPATATSAIFENVVAGTYAVSMFHDANGNGKLDTNFLGIPRESVGLSNNPRIMGPPRFKPSLFEVAGPTEITIRF